ncbi:hypothetical protein GO988_17475 [Hymenobacter sp. HMF4947]|uniref:Uncharacterized protein n=1 Tax=Hymenobacter ginkgonis TaxID=2682976 RepID=A0A7K1TIC5_9BACT|nr:hypothetical protein [Hymenobacter ginkgonis]MVN78122.1 hypothetical protein [Hymenobacter ginkgonis]
MQERQLPANDFLRHLRAELFEAARLVRETNLCLAERFYRLITDHEASQRQRMRAAYLSINQLALRTRDTAPTALAGFVVFSSDRS